MLGRIFLTLTICSTFVVGFIATASAQCPNGQASCGGKCVDLQKDDNNCGACGKTCERYEACGQGSCKLVCPDKQLTCGDVCVTAASNPDHCGGCGKRCPDDAYCSAGQCWKICNEATQSKQ